MNDVAAGNPNEGPWVRALLALLGVGFISAALLLVGLWLFDVPAPKRFLVVPLGIGSLGLLGLVGAGVGRAFARWLLAGFGVVLVGGAVAGVIDSYSWSSPVRFVIVVCCSMLLFGVLALVVALRSMLARRRDQLVAASVERP